MQLLKGDGIGDTEWEKLPKQLFIDNTSTAANVDLSSGTVSLPSGSTVTPINMAPQSGDSYRAVAIPQTVAAGKQLLSITIDGLTYGYTRETAMTYQPGKLHNFTMTINKREPSGDYEVKVNDEGIIPWVNDESSHQFTAMAYVTVHCPQYGTLKECITRAGYDYKTVQNLKVTGEISEDDIYIIRDEMPELHHLNIKDARLRHSQIYNGWFDHYNHDHDIYVDDMLPNNAFYSSRSIRSLVLPSTLKRLGENSLREMQVMYSTLEIPEGVTYIGEAAFSYVEYNGVELILPSTLDSICGAFRDVATSAS